MSQNSSNAFDHPLQVELGFSLALLAAYATLYGVAGAAWLCVPVPWFTRLAICALLAFHFLYVYRLHVAASLRCAVHTLAWDPVLGWRIRSRGGVWLRAELRSPVFVSRQLVAVRFRIGRFRSRSVIVVPDRLDAADFRRLRVRLLQSAHGYRD
ncbi:protein YgfX [Thiogranum longum]